LPPSKDAMPMLRKKQCAHIATARQNLDASGDLGREAPYGPLVPSLYALIAQRHMAEYGTTAEQLAAVAVAIRGHASCNPWAHKRKPITVEEVLSSPAVSTPLHQLDCSLISDGAAALVVTSLARARDLRQRPIRILGQGYGFTHQYAGSYDDICVTGAVRSGQDAFAQAGLTPADVDVAELYDCFTITVVVELEDLGFCTKGDGGSFVEGNRLSLEGALPVTTHGGLLSAAHPGLPGGFFHVVEGVQQVRGDAEGRQVRDAEVALVHGNGGILGVHATMLLSRA
jgi:acetyl-CoA acetyltransferase